MKFVELIIEEELGIWKQTTEKAGESSNKPMPDVWTRIAKKYNDE